MSLLTDAANAANVAKEALGALQTAADNILTGAENELPKLSDDALAFARDFVEQRAPASVKTYLHGLLDAVNAPVVGGLSAVVGGWLAVFKTDIDSAIGHLENQIAPEKTDAGTVKVPDAAATAAGAGTIDAGSGGGASGPGSETVPPGESGAPVAEPGATADAKPADQGGGDAAPDGA